MSVHIGIVIGPTITILINTIIPRLGGIRIYRCITFIAIGATIKRGGKPIPILIIVIVTIAVLIDAIIPNLLGIGSSIGVRIIAIAFSLSKTISIRIVLPQFRVADIVHTPDITNRLILNHQPFNTSVEQ